MPSLRSSGVPLSRSDERSLRNRLSRLLSIRGLSDDRFAELTGIERSRLNRIKNSRRQPTVEEALRIAHELQLEVAEIFWIEDA
jgi:transcriptional regulator with XRE-family HTH domain